MTTKQTPKRKQPPKKPMAETPINGKTYPMWGGLVDKKSDFIGGKLVEHDNHCRDAQTTITDIRLTPNGTDSAMIHVDGKEWGCACDVQYGGVGSDGKGNLTIHARFGTTWTLFRP